MHFAWTRYDALVSYVCAGAIVAGAVAETVWPLRQHPTSVARKWFANGVLFLFTNAAMGLVYRITTIALAYAMEAQHMGMLNRSTLPYSIRFAFGFLALDLVGYAAHRLNHSLPFLWRVHSVHHSETDLDVTSGIKFHPLEGVITHGLVLASIALFGFPVLAVLCVNLCSVLQDAFTHANIRIPRALERLLEALIITPGAHRVHHSCSVAHQQTNFGVVLSWWDRMFGTFKLREKAPATLDCGLDDVPAGTAVNAFGLLALPFRRRAKHAARSSAASV